MGKKARRSLLPNTILNRFAIGHAGERTLILTEEGEVHSFPAQDPKELLKQTPDWKNGAPHSDLPRGRACEYRY